MSLYIQKDSGEYAIQYLHPDRAAIEEHMMEFSVQENMDIEDGGLYSLLQKEYNFYQYIFENYGVEPRGESRILTVPGVFTFDFMEGFCHPYFVLDQFSPGSTERIEWVRCQLGRMLAFRDEFPSQIVDGIVRIIRREVPDFPFDNQITEYLRLE